MMGGGDAYHSNQEHDTSGERTASAYASTSGPIVAHHEHATHYTHAPSHGNYTQSHESESSYLASGERAYYTTPSHVHNAMDAAADGSKASLPQGRPYSTTPNHYDHSLLPVYHDIGSFNPASLHTATNTGYVPSSNLEPDSRQQEPYSGGQALHLRMAPTDHAIAGPSFNSKYSVADTADADSATSTLGLAGLSHYRGFLQDHDTLSKSDSYHPQPQPYVSFSTYADHNANAEGSFASTSRLHQSEEQSQVFHSSHNPSNYPQQQPSGLTGTSSHTHPRLHSHSSASATTSDQSPMQSPFAVQFESLTGHPAGYFTNPPAHMTHHHYAHTNAALQQQDFYGTAANSATSRHPVNHDDPKALLEETAHHRTSVPTSRFQGRQLSSGTTNDYQGVTQSGLTHIQEPAQASASLSTQDLSGRHTYSGQMLPYETSPFRHGPHRQSSYSTMPPQNTSEPQDSQRSNTTQYIYADPSPTYPLPHYNNVRPSTLDATRLQAYPEPSPTWSASPLISPAYAGVNTSAYGALSDYFHSAPGTSSAQVQVGQESNRQPGHRLSNASSPPTTSHSPASQDETMQSEYGRSAEGRQYFPTPRGRVPQVRSTSDSAKQPATRPATGPGHRSKSSSGGLAYTKKETRILEGKCSNCGNVFATINLRGHAQDFANEFDLVYYCLACAPESLGMSRAALEASIGLPLISGDASSKDARRSLDNVRSENGTSTELLAGTVKVAPRGPKKRIRATDVSSPTVCDVCCRWIAHGAPLAREPGADLAFNVEIVCTLCSGKYRRCSDCGGGGGARLGVGKWRCKELFSPGRKTCDLSHARQSSVTSMEYSTTRVRDIPKAEKPDLVKTCRAVFESALFSSLAVPEVLERGTAMADTYEEVVSRVEDGWRVAQGLIEEDAEEQEGYRRPRKVPPRKSAKQDDGSGSPDAESIEQVPPQVLRPSMNLSGYVSGEWDIRGGTFYITVSVPYSTGEQYEGSAHLISLLQKRVIMERQEMIESLVQQGKQVEALSIPPLLHAFTLLLFTPDSKLMAYMESKRQMIPLQRYLEKYPDTDRTAFPPHRNVYIGSQQKLQDWTVLVRRLQPPPTSQTPSSSNATITASGLPMQESMPYSNASG